ncbi:MAG: glycosyltransferase [Bacteroidia bacterium]|nr:glycosyltransferase [Bacteroidia bacterium]
MLFAFYSFLFLLTGVYALLLLRLRSGLRNLAEEETRDVPSTLSVSIVVPLRNELAALPELLRSLSGQHYPSGTHEVLLVDDHSEDGSAEELRRITHGQPSYRVLSVPDGMMGKKDAIAFGVQHAKGEVILTTDADCTHPPGWLAAMSDTFTPGVDVVAGPVVYADRGSLFKRLQALEFLGLVGVGAGFFGIGYPRICNGANFAYRREAFLRAGGYAGNRGIHSGDDEFLLQDIVYRQGGGARFTISPDSVVTAQPAPDFLSFMRQRIRWVSKSRHGSDSRFVSFLVLLFVYFVLLSLMPLAVLYAPYTVPLAVVIAVAKLALDTSVLLPSAALLRMPVRIPDIIIAELLHPFYLVIASIIGSTGAFTWKGRRLRNH